MKDIFKKRNDVLTTAFMHLDAVITTLEDHKGHESIDTKLFKLNQVKEDIRMDILKNKARIDSLTIQEKNKSN